MTEIIERLGEHYGRTSEWIEWDTGGPICRYAETYNDELDRHDIVIQQTTRRGHWEAVGKKFRAGFEAGVMFVERGFHPKEGLSE